MFVPYYKFTETLGKSGINSTSWFKGSIQKSGSHQVCIFGFTRNGNMDHPNLNRFNPYRHLQVDGTTLGYKGANYYFSDKSILGRLLKIIFA